MRREWLDGGVYHLKRGEDYTITDDAFRNRVSLESMRLGIYVKTAKVEDGYVIQAFSPGVPDELLDGEAEAARASRAHRGRRAA